MKTDYTKETKDGYPIIATFQDIYETKIVLVKHSHSVMEYEYIIAWNYDEKDGTWAQGHYFWDLLSAVNYLMSNYEVMEV